jgi:hypothetical protein
MAESITLNELLSEIRRCQAQATGGVTISELTEQTGRCRGVIAKELGTLIKAGKVESLMESRPSIDGRMRKVPAYRPVVTAKPDPTRGKGASPAHDKAHERNQK